MSFFSTSLYSEDYYVNTWACLVGCRNIETKNDPYHWFETKFYKSKQKLCCQNVSNKLNIKNPTRLFLIQPPSSFPIPFSWHSIPPYQSWTAPKWWTSTFESPAAKSEPRSFSQKDNKLVIPPSPIKEIATNGDRPIILNNVVSVKSQWSPSLSTPRVYGMLLLLLCKKHSFWLKKKVVFDYMVQKIRWVFFVFLIFLLYLMVYYGV